MNHSTAHLVSQTPVRPSLQKKGNIVTSASQLKGAKDSLESWFSSELSNHWNFFSMIYCQNINPDVSICQQCSEHIITGMFHFFLLIPKTL